MNDPMDRANQRLVATVYVTDNDGVRHMFGPGDDVPTWARRKITNPHAWGWPTPPRHGITLEVNDDVRAEDGLATFLDLTCQHAVDERDRFTVARFEIAELLAEGEVPQWQWTWVSKLNGPRGPFAANSTVRWPGTGPTAGWLAAPHPRDDQAIDIQCNWRGCTVRWNRRWSVVRARFDALRHAGMTHVSLAALARTDV